MVSSKIQHFLIPQRIGRPDKLVNDRPSFEALFVVMCDNETAARRRRAKELVDQIQNEHGHVSEETLGKIKDQTLRTELINALKTKDGMIGSTIITLAKNLYTSNARFVFELLQNADDNRYSKTRKTRDTPFISFHVYPRKIVVEYNEDGFTPDNLRAICNVGQSTKKGAQGYIGEKGIGFKSVFMVAWKVFIQSGDFSFCFEHRKGGSGMGMISPIWQEPEHTLPDSLTRITLFLHDSDDAAFLETQRQLIFSQFHELQDTFLLFLKNIKKVNLKFYDVDHKMIAEVIHSLENSSGGSIANLTKETITGGNTERKSRAYHVTRHVATGLQKNDNREYSEEEEVQRKYSRSEVVLAFPLAPDSTPLVEAQNVFAFLPLRSAGFSFLIQADFVTEANRQDVIPASPRNLGLLDGIAQAFIKGVLEFCEHHTLVYQWMRYLPNQTKASFQPFWKQLVDKIHELLKSTPVLHCRSEEALRCITELRLPVTDSEDKDGNPLFDDINPPVYLSSRYGRDDLMTLEPYGLKRLFMIEFVARAESDLKSPASRMKASKDEDWHSRAARLLALPFVKGWESRQQELRGMCLIPLQNGQWISAASGPTYYASSAGVQIPGDLGLNLIDPIAARNSDRKTLFDHLGATEASINQVRSKILERYNSSGNAPRVSLQASRNHLKYLYLTHKSADDVVPIAFSNVYVYTQEESVLCPNSTDVYAPDSNKYGVRELLKPTPPGPNPGDGAPGLSVPFLHQVYLEDIPDRPAEHPCSWTAFLNKYLKIRRRPRLVCNPTQESASLSNITHYLQRHRPERFLRVIHYYWQTEGRIIATKESTNTEMRAMEVLCRGGGTIPLFKTFLPTPSLERLQARYMVDTEFFPFLKLPLPPRDDAESDEWKFLHTDFGVGRHDDLDFYLAILSSILDANESAETVMNSARVYGVYDRIQANLAVSEDQSRQQSMIRELFEARSAILIPDFPGRRPTWARPSQCVWNGPQAMQTKYPVKTLCQAYLAASESGASSLNQFCRATLGISDCTWSDLVDEVKHLKATSCTDFDRINGLYTLIDKSIDRTKVHDVERLRQVVDDDALIYVNVNGRHNWFKTSQCLWSSATTIRGRTTLNDHYEDSKDFFVIILGVSELSLDMVLDELVEKSARQTPMEEIKETLWALTSFLVSNTPASSPKRILESRIFPVKYPNGQVVLRTSNVEFGIVDRRLLGDSFTGQVNLLDFSLEEVRFLKPFFAWTDLEKRYLSNMVKEISQAEGGGPVPIASRNRDISQKAPGLFRIAAHYNSPRVLENDLSLKDLLQGARVYETDGISSSLVLSQGGREVTIEIEKSELHIREDGSGLQIYVPRDSRSQEFCYLSKLPPRIFEWMMTHPDTQIREKIEPEAILVVTKILNAKLSSVNWILEEAGIIEVAGAETVDDQGAVEQLDLDDDDSETEEVQRVHDTQPITLNDVFRGPEALLTPSTSETAGNESMMSTSAVPAISATFAQSSHSGVVTRVVYNNPRHTTAVAGSPPLSGQRIEDERTAPTHAGVPSRPDPEPETIGIAVDRETRYLALLDNMINKARTSSFPTLGSFDMSQLLQTLSEFELPAAEFSLDIHWQRSATQRERDNKIGAAGELFVFELLSQLDPELPGFGQANWQSTIRKYVKVHPKYALMDDWHGRETADITYNDSSGVLTDLLIDKSYLAPNHWRGMRPMYYIEVKSTTGHCGRPFFMSKHQYRRMQEFSVTSQDSPSPDAAVYVVFRVFDVGMGYPGIRIYVDPEAARRTGSLVFTTETWSVVPAQVQN